MAVALACILAGCNGGTSPRFPDGKGLIIALSICSTNRASAASGIKRHRGQLLNVGDFDQTVAVYIVLPVVSRLLRHSTLGTELLPCGNAVGVKIHFEGRILIVPTKVPNVVHAGIVVVISVGVIHVYTPVLEWAGVSGGSLQLGGFRSVATNRWFPLSYVIKLARCLNIP